nr:tRNA (adenosine(37)-N6)-threonylcarbamoyltransferase complex dimerization subunit type 1 TsaB [uncultured Rhodoferax sp.]
MNLLAFDTSTERMSIALQRGTGDTAMRWQHDAPGGALTSTHLIPEIQRLMALAGLQFGDLSAIVFGAGPGSFTGLRTACSVAQGLGFGAAVPVLPVDTLLAVAQDAHQQLGAPERLAVTAMLDARMDELYTASYLFESGQWTCIKRYSLISPESLQCDADHVLAGNVFAEYGERLPHGGQQRVPALPTAQALLRLAPALLAAGAAVSAEQALPTYIRDKVAQTTQERLAAKLATSAHPVAVSH